VEELTSLLDYNFGEPGEPDPSLSELALAPGHPFENVLQPNRYYWTYTTHPSSNMDDNRKALVRLGDGDVDDRPRYGSSGFAFCVRFRQGEGK